MTRLTAAIEEELAADESAARIRSAFHALALELLEWIAPPSRPSLVERIREYGA